MEQLEEPVLQELMMNGFGSALGTTLDVALPWRSPSQNKHVNVTSHVALNHLEVIRFFVSC
jgi:hypothetical protein